MTKFDDVYKNDPQVMPLNLITITHPSLGTWHFTNDNAAHEYDGVKYSPYPYQISYPDESEDSDNAGKITAAALDDSLKVAVRQNGRDMRMTIDALYLGHDGGFSPMGGRMQFALTNIVLTLTSIQADLKIDNILQDAFPGHLMSPENCPGIR